MTPEQRAEAALTELQRLGQEYDQALADGCDVRRLAEAIKARAAQVEKEEG